MTDTKSSCLLLIFFLAETFSAITAVILFAQLSAGIKKNNHLTTKLPQKNKRHHQWLFFKQWVCWYGEVFLFWLFPWWPRAQSSCRVAIYSSQWIETIAVVIIHFALKIMVLFLDESPRGASLPLSSLWEDLRPEAGPEGAHGPAHRRKTLRLRALWQGIRTPPLPTYPSPASLQQNDLHTAS